MDDKKLGLVESRFADIIWANEPLPSRELVKLCESALNWKKPTTYTVLRRLCERGLFQNEGGMVTSTFPYLRITIASSVIFESPHPIALS